VSEDLIGRRGEREEGRGERGGGRGTNLRNLISTKMPHRKGTKVVGPSGRAIIVGGPTWNKLTKSEQAKLKSISKEKIKSNIQKTKNYPKSKKVLPMLAIYTGLDLDEKASIL